MKKLSYSVIFILLLQLSIKSQMRPGLPLGFYDGFSYSLRPQLNYTDSVQLSNEMKKIAIELLKWHSEAATGYSISDSTELYNYLTNSSDLSIFFGKYKQAIDNIKTARKVRPSPPYIIPYSLEKVAYCEACLVQNDDGSMEFGEIFSHKLKEQYRAINGDFINDIVNQSKGSYTKATTEVWRKNVIRIIEQAIKNSNGTLNFATANLLFTTYQNYLLRKKYQVKIESALYDISPSKVKEQIIDITMRDGVKLKAYVYADVTNSEKLPAIISLSPYPSGFEAARGNVFATNGYIYVYVDTRGRRESEGSFMPFEDDARDFYDIIDWVSKQSWCNGKVASTGGSYLGFNQWQAVRKRYKHPALKAINPIASVGFGIDFPRTANMFYPYMLRWATYVSGRDLNRPLFSDGKFWNEKYYDLYRNRLPFYKLDSVTGMANPFFQKWLSHPAYDKYWQNIMPEPKDYESINIPVLSITGYYDGDQVGAMYYYDQHQKYGSTKGKNKHYLLIGPYDHLGAQWQPGNIQNGITIESEALIPIYKYVIRWFDWVLKGKPQPIFINDKITYFETGNHIWKGTSSLKKLTTDSLEFFLSPSIIPNNKRNDLRALILQRPASGELVNYNHDIAMTLDSVYLFSPSKAFDDSIYMTSPHNLVFESTPLQSDIIVSDKIRSRIYASINVPDADFEVSLEEVDADGKSRNIGNGRIRVRYRNGGHRAQFANPGEVLHLNFEDIFLYIKKIDKGSKIRLVFQCINNPWAEKNYGFGGEVSRESTSRQRIIRVNIITGGKFASKIVLPVSRK